MYKLSEHDRRVVSAALLFLARGDKESALKDLRYLLGVDDVRREMIEKEIEKYPVEEDDNLVDGLEDWTPGR